MSWVGGWLGAIVITNPTPDDPTDPPAPIEVDVEHASVETIDYVAHARSRLAKQFRGDP